MRDVTVKRHGGPVPYYQRPKLRVEFIQIWRYLKEVELPKAPTFLACLELQWLYLGTSAFFC